MYPGRYAKCSFTISLVLLFHSAHPGTKADSCSNDGDCPTNEICINARCIDPCQLACGTGADCKTFRKKPFCACPSGTTGDPFSSCLPVGTKVDSCTNDEDCPPNEACFTKKCVDSGHKDEIRQPHRPPRIAHRHSCTDDGDCLTKETICIKERCIDPCQGACGTGADCKTVRKIPICSCPSGTTGDPFSSCLPVGTKVDSCTNDEDCPTNEECFKKKCVDPCKWEIGRREEGSVPARPSKFLCPPEIGTKVDSCTNDEDCPPNEECFTKKCVDPGHKDEIGQPHRPPRIGKRMCSHDSNCSFEEACINGKCEDPCSGRCGLNAECRVRNHEAICSCPPDLGGDPSIHCLPPEAVVTKKGDPSRTEVTVKDEEGRWITKKFYSGDVIFEDDFSNGTKIDDSKWSHEVRMPSNNGYGFVTYHDSPRNSYVKDNLLFIKPTVLDNETVRHGTRSLESCTGRYDSRECERVARSYDILPPIDAALLTTKNSMHFKYGIVTIRAKLPVGDWILPEIRMEPVNTITYGVYHSGLIDLAFARGNRRLTQETRDIGNNNLEMGFEIGPKLQRTTNTNSNGWGSGFHNYTLIWTPDNLKFQVDDIPAVALCPQGRKLYKAFGIEIDRGRESNWQRGSNIAPFDKPFYLSIGLSAGGLKHFPDESRNGDGKKKPWNDFKVKALLTFWDNRNDWLESWEKNDGKDSSLQIDYVRITAI